jgi:hypothetical protein
MTSPTLPIDLTDQVALVAGVTSHRGGYVRGNP